ncbi:MAG: biopolymer transporter ExbD [Planctomycetota bacterium]
MAIRFRCQHCSGLMSISSRQAGMTVQCPTCGEQTLVPLEDIFSSSPDRNSGTATETAVDDQQEEGWQAPPEESFAAYRESRDEDVHVEPEGAINDGSSEFDDVGQAEQTTEDDENEPEPFQLKVRQRADDEMDLTPMVDVTFQLLIFFMVTASFALQKSIQVPTPDPEKKGATQQLQILEDLEGSSIRVQIDAANVITIDDEPLADPARLADALKDKMRKEQKTEILISAHAAALHRSVISVIDAANHIGMQKIRLISRQGKSE